MTSDMFGSHKALAPLLEQRRIKRRKRVGRNGSSIASGEILMDYSGRVEQDFALLVEGNPLKAMRPRQRVFVYSSIFTALGLGRWRHEVSSDQASSALSLIHSTAATTANLLSSMEALYERDFCLNPVKQAMLEVLLTEYAHKIDWYSQHLPQAGHMDDFVATRLVVQASLIIRACTGKFFDGPLSELGQLMPGSEGFSEEAIRKRRKRLKMEYPEIYSALSAKAECWSGTG